MEERSTARRHNLPPARTSFVGREREVEEIERALATTRLLTLTGVGGSGKTRLAAEAARDLTDAYPDGVWLVELAPLREEVLVPQAIAAAVGIREQPNRSLTDTLVDAFSEQKVLLVLDNCEHLVEAVARLVDTLVDSCANLRILATSREALRLAGEINYPVPPLSVPDPKPPLVDDDLSNIESVRLFVERARYRRPAFALTPHNAGVVAEICRRLEGIPLAIELAAARVDALSPEQIARRLEGILKLLVTGSRTAPPKQRTLRGTLDWSYDLLVEAEQTLFERLSVFAGGWTLEAAEAVVSGGGVEEDDVLDLLSGLVDKSLVVSDTTEDGGVRYRLLEPVRQYAREKLEESGDAETPLRRHAEFFLALAQEAEAQWGGPEEGAWLERLEAEHGNLRAALFWTLEQGEAETMLHFAGALSWFWEARGHASEGTKWLEEVLAMGGIATTTARAGALFGLGNILRRSDFERAQACLEEALALYKRLGDRERVAESLAYLGWVVECRGDAARAAALFEEGLAAARESEYSRGIPGILNALAYNTFERGDFKRAQELWGEALALQRERGSTMGRSAVLLNMGYTELVRGDRERATALLEESLALSQEVGDKFLVAAGLMCLGIAATLRGEPDKARVMLKDSLAIDAELGNKIDIAEDLECLAEAASALGQRLRAARLWGMACTLREDIGVSWGPTERLLHGPQLAAARSQLDKTSWEAAFAEGKAMGLEEAVEYALATEDSADEEHAPSTLLVPHTGETLTAREVEVLRLLSSGASNKQIAEELVISPFTVKRHVASVMRKLEAPSRTHAAARARQLGFV